jgi:hypothetical protein
MKKMMTLMLALALLAAPVALADESARVGDPYPLNVCAVAGEPLGSMGDPIVKVVEGREVRFCCAGCVGKYEKSTATYSAEIDKKIVAQQEADYPVTTCVNSGAELEGGGKTFVAGNRLMKTCCGNCQKAIEADPAAAIEKLNEAAIAKQAAAYPASAVCPVSGKAIEGDGQAVVLAGKMVKLCCAGCKEKASAEPTAMLEKVYGDKG